MFFFLSYLQLFLVGVHFGHNYKSFEFFGAWFLFAIRANIILMNLYDSTIRIKLSFKVIKGLTKSNSPIWFVNMDPSTDMYTYWAALACGEFYINSRWESGLISNFLSLFKFLVYKVVHSGLSPNDGYYSRFADRWSLTRFSWPRAIFTTSTLNSPIPLKEAMCIGVPTFGIVDSNAWGQSADIAIPGNDDSSSCLIFYNSLFSCFISQRKFFNINFWFFNIRRGFRKISFADWLSHQYFPKGLDAFTGLLNFYSNVSNLMEQGSRLFFYVNFWKNAMVKKFVTMFEVEKTFDLNAILKKFNDYRLNIAGLISSSGLRMTRKDYRFITSFKSSPKYLRRHVIRRPWYPYALLHNPFFWDKYAKFKNWKKKRNKFFRFFSLVRHYKLLSQYNIFQQFPVIDVQDFAKSEFVLKTVPLHNPFSKTELKKGWKNDIFMSYSPTDYSYSGLYLGGAPNMVFLSSFDSMGALKKQKKKKLKMDSFYYFVDSDVRKARPNIVLFKPYKAKKGKLRKMGTKILKKIKLSNNLDFPRLAYDLGKKSNRKSIKALILNKCLPRFREKLFLKSSKKFIPFVKNILHTHKERRFFKQNRDMLLTNLQNYDGVFTLRDYFEAPDSAQSYMFFENLLMLHESFINKTVAPLYKKHSLVKPYTYTWKPFNYFTKRSKLTKFYPVAQRRTSKILARRKFVLGNYNVNYISEYMKLWPHMYRIIKYANLRELVKKRHTILNFKYRYMFPDSIKKKGFRRLNRFPELLKFFKNSTFRFRSAFGEFDRVSKEPNMQYIFGFKKMSDLDSFIFRYTEQQKKNKISFFDSKNKISFLKTYSKTNKAYKLMFKAVISNINFVEKTINFINWCDNNVKFFQKNSTFSKRISRQSLHLLGDHFVTELTRRVRRARIGILLLGERLRKQLIVTEMMRLQWARFDIRAHRRSLIFREKVFDDFFEDLWATTFLEKGREFVVQAIFEEAAQKIRQSRRNRAEVSFFNKAMGDSYLMNRLYYLKEFLPILNYFIHRSNKSKLLRYNFIFTQLINSFWLTGFFNVPDFVNKKKIYIESNKNNLLTNLKTNIITREYYDEENKFKDENISHLKAFKKRKRGWRTILRRRRKSWKKIASRYFYKVKRYKKDSSFIKRNKRYVVLTRFNIASFKERIFLGFDKGIDIYIKPELLSVFYNIYRKYKIRGKVKVFKNRFKNIALFSHLPNRIRFFREPTRYKKKIRRFKVKPSFFNRWKGYTKLKQDNPKALNKLARRGVSHSKFYKTKLNLKAYKSFFKLSCFYFRTNVIYNDFNLRKYVSNFVWRYQNTPFFQKKKLNIVPKFLFLYKFFKFRKMFTSYWSNFRLNFTSVLSSIYLFLYK